MSFPYFGNKKALLKYYQPPLYGLIMETFAGSAKYACKYGLKRDVWINDKYAVIYEIWRWIQQATKKDIQDLPSLTKRGETLDDHKYLSDPEKWLLGFATGVGRAQPSNKITAFAEKREGTKQLRESLFRLCGKINHWNITNLDYSEIPNMEATWHIDPPYEHFGKHYKCNGKTINFEHLGEWCRERKGQVMVCEAALESWFPRDDKGRAALEPEKPNYLPFKRLRTDISRLQRKDQYVEIIYYRSDKKKGFGLSE